MKIRSLRGVLLLGCLPALAPPPAPSRASDVVQRWIEAVEAAGRNDERLDDRSWRRVTAQGSRTSEAVCREGVAWSKVWNVTLVSLDES